MESAFSSRTGDEGMVRRQAFGKSKLFEEIAFDRVRKGGVSGSSEGVALAEGTGLTKTSMKMKGVTEKAQHSRQN